MEEIPEIGVATIGVDENEFGESESSEDVEYAALFEPLLFSCLITLTPSGLLTMPSKAPYFSAIGL